MCEQLPNDIRFVYLDAARAFALLLGIVFHTSLSFVPFFIGWAVMDIATSDAVLPFIHISHSFRMALFFLIAGFFSHIAFHKKGVSAFAQSRFIRIAVPFVIGWFMLRPLLVSGWVIGAESMQGEANLLSGLSQGLASLSEFPKSMFVGTHLWFLFYLILITISVLCLRHLICRYQVIWSKLITCLDSCLAFCCCSRCNTLFLALPTAICLWFMSHWGIDTPDKSLRPNLPVLTLFGAFFTFGWLLNRQPVMLEKLLCVNAARLIGCLLAITVSSWLSTYEMQISHSQYLLFKAGFVFSYAVMMWSLIFTTLTICKKLFARPNVTVRYLAECSYWLYLIHLPIVIWLQIAFAELAMHWLIKLASISVITLALSILLYEVFVRSTLLGVILNGKKYRFRLLRRKNN